MPKDSKYPSSPPTPPTFGRADGGAPPLNELDAIFAERERELTAHPKRGKVAPKTRLDPADTQRPAKAPNPELFDRATQVRCYSGGATLVAQPTAASGNPNEATVLLELAPKEDPSRPADWSAKIAVQLKPGELTELAALLLGLVTQMQIKRTDKQVEIERQSGHVYFRASENPALRVTLAAPIPDVFRLSVLVLNQLQRSTQSPDQQAMIAALRGAYALRP